MKYHALSVFSVVYYLVASYKIIGLLINQLASQKSCRLLMVPPIDGAVVILNWLFINEIYCLFFKKYESDLRVSVLFFRFVFIMDF